MIDELSRAGKIQAVTGLVSPDELGPTLTHEHILSDADFFISIPFCASDLLAVLSCAVTSNNLFFKALISEEFFTGFF